ncbi:MAG: hypothetical protein JSS91_01800 [Bacteroidetes bacterium]|nr:hypothetical protein [Bacteroidota bacterium]
MNRKILIPLLLILPAVLFITAGLLKFAQGPFYLNFYDPSYVYLINGLNLAQLNGYGVGHFDHPGTTVQVICAAVIKIYYSFTSSNSDLVNDVFARPEDYLLKINIVLNFINCFVLFLFGYFFYSRSKNLPVTFFLMISPFVSTELFYGMIIDTPDNLLVSASLLVMGIIFYCLYKKENEYSLKEIIIFSVVIAFGLATKLNFIPMIFIPMIMLNGMKNKLVYLLFVLIFFIIFILPGISNMDYFINWVEGLILKEGKHGKGAATVFNTYSFPKNLISIFATDPLFGLTYLIILSVYIFTVITKFRFKKTETFFPAEIKFRLLTAVLTAMTLQIIIVSKHYAQYYMIPSFMLTVTGLYLSYLVITALKPGSVNSIRKKYLYITTVSVMSLWITYQLVSSYYEGTEMKESAYEMVDFVEKQYKDSEVIPAFGTANKDIPLAFATIYAGSRKEFYKNILEKKLRSDIYFNQWVNEFYFISDPEVSLRKLKSKKSIILQLSAYGSINGFLDRLREYTGSPELTYGKIFTNGNNESAYEIYLR